MEEILEECRLNMEMRIESFEKDLKRVRTGRASVGMLDGVKVSYYGNLTPINQVSSLSTPDARTIIISPFEKNTLRDIEKAIMKADLGLQPTNDGNIVRVPIPQLTEERRKDLVKSLKKMGEETRIAIRHIRRDSNETVKKLEKQKELAEDDSKKIQLEIQKTTDQFIKVVEDKLIKKEKEVMTV